MKTDLTSDSRLTLAETVAGEDLCCGDFVALFSQTCEVPSYFWDSTGGFLPPQELIRLKMTPAEAGRPLKILGLCLPFVYATRPDGQTVTIDLRRTQLVRLDRDCAKRIWKAMRKPASMLAVDC